MLNTVRTRRATTSASHSSFRTRFRCFKRPPTLAASLSGLTRQGRAAAPEIEHADRRTDGQLHCWFPKSTDFGGQETQGRFHGGGGDDRPSSTLTLMTIPIRRDPTRPQREMDSCRISQSGRRMALPHPIISPVRWCGLPGQIVKP